MIVIADKPGQLANRLFLFAHFIAWAREYGFRIANPAFDEYGEYFRTFSHDLFCRYPPRASFIKPGPRLRSAISALTFRVANSLAYRAPRGIFWDVVRIGDRDTCELSNPRFLKLSKAKKLVFVQGWLFRDHASLEKYADLVRQHFEPVQSIRNRVEMLIESFRRDCDVLVGVHIRQGDYRQHLGGKYFYSLEQYVALLQQLSKLLPQKKLSFLICSNEKQVVDECGLHFSYGTGHPIEDLYLLAQCDYLVGPPSTYNMWASFYGSVPLYTIDNPNEELTLDRFSSDCWRVR